MEIFNVFGTLASLVGLGIAIVQIYKIKKISAATKESSEKTRTKIVELLFAMDVPKALKIVPEIQTYNRNKKFDSSVLRMHDLKEHLAQIKNNQVFMDFIDVKKCGKYITGVSVEISNLEKEMHYGDNALDVVRINAFLEELFTFLSDVDTMIKREAVKYDS